MNITEIVLDQSINPRSRIDDVVVERYADAISAGEVLPPIVIERGTLRLLGGWHRHAAYMSLGLAEVDVEIHDVPPAMTAKLYAASLNARHGLPLAESDARSLAREMYDQAPDVTVTAVASALGRPRKTVEGWVSDLAEEKRAREEHEREVRRCVAFMLKELGWTQQQIADALGVTRQAVGQAMANSPLLDTVDERVLRDAVVRAPEKVADAIAALAESWREERIFAHWTPSERDLLKRLRSGETVVVNMRDEAHGRFWKWCEQAGHAERIDRRSEWGNPFVLPDDGDRDTVCDAFADHYWPHKPSLHAKVRSLQGKALGCWCAPARCHGDFIAEEAWRR